MFRIKKDTSSGGLIILVISMNYIYLCICWIIKCLIVTDTRCKHESHPYLFTIQHVSVHQPSAGTSVLSLITGNKLIHIGLQINNLCMYMYNVHVLGYIISPACRTYPVLLEISSYSVPLQAHFFFLICSYYDLQLHTQFIYVAVVVSTHCIVSGPPKQTDCLHPVGALLCRSLGTQAWRVNSF